MKINKSCKCPTPSWLRTNIQRPAQIFHSSKRILKYSPNCQNGRVPLPAKPYEVSAPPRDPFTQWSDSHNLLGGGKLEHSTTVVQITNSISLHHWNQNQATYYYYGEVIQHFLEQWCSNRGVHKTRNHPACIKHSSFL